jgi:hypothetical protein
LQRDPMLKLSAADALHVARSAEGEHCRVTFDVRMVEAANGRRFKIETQ